jgi:hypothetical protein
MIGLDGTHTYNVLLHLIKYGKWIKDEENLDETVEEEFSITQNLKKIMHSQFSSQISNDVLCTSDQVPNTGYRGQHKENFELLGKVSWIIHFN